MRRVLVIYTVIIAVCAYVYSMKKDSRPTRQYELVFFDDFKRKGLDTTLWNVIPRNRYSWGKYMSAHPSLFRYKKGYLRLMAVPNTFCKSDTAKFLTAGISTEKKRTITYGKVEVRARFKGAMGSWPAIWLFRAEPSKIWPDPEYAEIDIVEYPGKEKYVMQTVHNYYTMQLKKTTYPPYTVSPAVEADRFNTYTVEVLPEAIICSINGKETFRYPNIKIKEMGQYPFGCELFLMLDMQVGAAWLPKPDKSTYPAYMDIDWVKMYKLKSE